MSSAPGRGETWIAVLVKDFDSAKQRLSPALVPAQRRRLAIDNARLALAAAAASGHAIAVCGSAEAAREAEAAGVPAILEAVPRGQNAAAQTAIDVALTAGARELLIVSSDIPGISPAALRAVSAAAGDGERAAVAAAAVGRGGTNALLLRPPGVIGLHFGDDSLAKFEADAAARGVTMAVLEDTDLALDLDEPADLDLLAARP